MFSLPKLPYSYDALEPYFDKMTMEIHHAKHHQAYIDKLNAALEGHEELAAKPIEALLGNLDSVPEAIRTLVRNNGGGHYNHSLFWQVMGPESGVPEGELGSAIDSVFGGLEGFRSSFTEAALGQFGSGWAFLAFSQGKLVICSTLNQDSPLTRGDVPLLALDVWEHAYYLRYQNRRAEYIAQWFSVVNWGAVGKKFNEACA